MFDTHSTLTRRTFSIAGTLAKAGGGGGNCCVCERAVASLRSSATLARRTSVTVTMVRIQDFEKGGQNLPLLKVTN